MKPGMSQSGSQFELVPSGVVTLLANKGGPEIPFVVVEGSNEGKVKSGAVGDRRGGSAKDSNVLAIDSSKVSISSKVVTGALFSIPILLLGEGGAPTCGTDSEAGVGIGC